MKLLKKFVSTVLAAATALSLLSFNSFAAGNTGSEIAKAKQLGILTAEQGKRLDKQATQLEADQMAERALKKVFGTSGQYLPDRIKRASSTEAASRYYFAATMFYSAADIVMDFKYPGYEKIMDTSFDGNSDYGVLMPDARMYCIKSDGTLSYCSADDFSDSDEITPWNNPQAKAENNARMHIDYGNIDAVNYMLMCFDRETALAAMEPYKDHSFRPKKKMTVGEIATALVRWYGSQEGLPETISVSKAGTYDKTIITKELLNKKTSLPDASNQKLPAWHGILGGKTDWGGWLVLGNRSDRYMRESEVKALADCGFNHITVMFSASWLQGPDYKKGTVNEKRLKEFDRVLALCMKYDIHLNLVCNELPGYKCNESDAFTDSANKIKEKGKAKELADIWGVMAKRYKGISNKYLSFNLFNEIGLQSEAEYKKYMGPSVNAIFKEDKDRVVIADIHPSTGITGEEMAKMGVSLCFHHYEPTGFGYIKNADKKYIHSVKWPYKLTEVYPWYDNDVKVGDVIDAKKSFDLGNITLNKVKATADKYNVGFIVGEFGFFFEGIDGLQQYMYTEETQYNYYKDMTEQFEKEGIPWCATGFVDLISAYPQYKGSKYTKLENSRDYLNENLAAFFRRVNGVLKLTGSKKDGSVTLRWGGVYGAEGYKIYELDAKTNKYKQVAYIKGTQKTLTGLSKGTHTYKVAPVVKNNGKKQNGNCSNELKVTV